MAFLLSYFPVSSLSFYTNKPSLSKFNVCFTSKNQKKFRTLTSSAHSADKELFQGVICMAKNEPTPFTETVESKSVSKVKQSHLEFHHGTPSKRGERGEEIKEMEKKGKFMVTCIHCNPNRVLKTELWFLFKSDGLRKHYEEKHNNALDKEACKYCGNQYNEKRKKKDQKGKKLAAHEATCVQMQWVRYFEDGFWGPNE